MVRTSNGGTHWGSTKEWSHCEYYGPLTGLPGGLDLTQCGKSWRRKVQKQLLEDQRKGTNQLSRVTSTGGRVITCNGIWESQACPGAQKGSGIK